MGRCLMPQGSFFIKNCKTIDKIYQLENIYNKVICKFYRYFLYVNMDIEINYQYIQNIFLAKSNKKNI